jgi:hypothetical protein
LLIVCASFRVLVLGDAQFITRKKDSCPYVHNVQNLSRLALGANSRAEKSLKIFFQ